MAIVKRFCSLVCVSLSITATALTASAGLARSWTGDAGGVYVRCDCFTTTDTSAISARGGIKPNTWNGYVGGGGRVSILRFADAGVAVVPNVLRGTGGTEMSASEVAKLPNPDGREPDARTGLVYWGTPPAGLGVLLK